RRGVSTFVLTMLAALGVAACDRANDQHAEARHPQQAGQPVNPYAMAGHIVAGRADLLTGDSRGAQKHIEAMASDITRSARIPDVSRPIDHEAARAAVRPLAGVRTSLWLDRANFVVMVGDQQHRSMAMIDKVCLALEPLGDTLAVVVNVQDVTAKNPDGATTLSRNCQLQEGQRAFMQAKREVDVVPKETRERFKEMQRK
ncbi:MAG: hypothetical protein ABJA60_06165, partial [Nitrosospira sp.]